MRTKDGGPAFPAHTWLDENRTVPMGGMSLRDYIATPIAAALILSALNESKADSAALTEAINMVASVSYTVADAMLAAREGERA